ncbi:hypothetical protein ABT370_34055, partial [Streptomyces rubradiris]
MSFAAVARPASGDTPERSGTGALSRLPLGRAGAAPAPPPPAPLREAPPPADLGSGAGHGAGSGSAGDSVAVLA